MDVELSELDNYQKKLSPLIVSQSFKKHFRVICGVDVSYSASMGYSCAVIFDMKKNRTLEITYDSKKVDFPYIPGYLMYREASPILSVLDKTQQDFDLLLVDGHGQLHPRQCGLASYLGLKLNKPTIGVAKNLLCGNILENSNIEFDGKILGKQLVFQNKKIYVSIGHKIGLEQAAKIVKKLVKDGFWYPEPLRLADTYSKTSKNKIN